MAQNPNGDDAKIALPFLIILYLVLVGSYVVLLVIDPTLRQPARLIPFTALMIIHGTLHWFGQRLPEHRRWMGPYFVVQGILAFSISLVTGFQGVILGLYMALIGQAGGFLWPNVRAVVLTALALVALLIINFFVLQQAQALIEHLPTIGLLSLFILVYVLLFVRQAEARDRAQTLLAELEDAHRQLQAYADQVEELTINQERERMARELHDTLAQGVAGLIMQLEAVDSHLENADPAKAQTVVQQAMHRARRTLDEARRAIQALRAGVLEQGSLVDALEQEIAQFETTTGVQATLKTPSELPAISSEKAQAILRVVQESLSNTARHADANHVAVQLAKNDDELVISVQDDGPGFDPEEAMKRPGRFGLAGMQERAARLGGKLDVESAPGKGTRVTLRLGENA